MLMTVAEHRDIYGAVAESVVADAYEKLDHVALDARVLKGCELLDKKHPGWADKIDLETFDLQSGAFCVIGQVYGDYSRIGDLLPGAHVEDILPIEEAHGFAVTSENDDGPVWDLLEQDWVVAIAYRQSLTLA